MDIFSIVNEKASCLSLKARSKDECIRELSGLISPLLPELKESDILEGLMERESKGSTAFGEGIAIPHARIKNLDTFVVSIAISKKGIDFESLDKKRTKIFFTIVGPGDKNEHYLKILAQISRVAKNRYARAEILNAKSTEALKEAFLRYVSPDEEKEKKEEHRNHKLLIITLYKKRHFDDVIELLISKGIGGASVLDSKGVRNILSGVPLFSEFINFTGERSEMSKTIICVVDKRLIPPFVEEIESILGDLDKHSGAMVLALDLFYMKGTFEVL